MVAKTTEKLSEEGGKRGGKVVMNVDQLIKSAVINELGDVKQSEDDSCDEEDALNISSMSLLTPLAEVVNSPEEMMMMVRANKFSFMKIHL